MNALNRRALTAEGERYRARSRRGRAIACLRMVFVVTWGASALVAHAVAPGYRIVGLGAGTANDVSDSGLVVGVSDGVATLWDSGGYKISLSSPGSYSEAAGINASGLAVGWYSGSAGSQAVVWNTQTGQATPLDNGGLRGSYGLAINNAGQVAGNTLLQDGTGRYQSRVVVWTSGVPTILDYGGRAYGINDQGQAVGYSGDDGHYGTVVRPTVWSGAGTGAGLTPLGYVSNLALAINNAGVIVGQTWPPLDAGEETRALLWQGGTVTDLGAGAANDINDAGQIVGTLDGLGAALWESGTAINLNHFVSGTGWTLQSATGINEEGWIVGSGYNQAVGDYQAYLLIPVPEPQVYALILSGVILLGVMRRRWPWDPRLS